MVEYNLPSTQHSIRCELFPHVHVARSNGADQLVDRLVVEVPFHGRHNRGLVLLKEDARADVGPRQLGVDSHGLIIVGGCGNQLLGRARRVGGDYFDLTLTHRELLEILL